MQHPSGTGLRFQRRTAAAQMHLQAHHQFFPQRIDRRVGDLGEALLEVVVEQVGLIGEHGQGDVIPHAVGGLFARSGHVLNHQLKVFSGEAKGGLLLQQLQIAQLLAGGPGLGIQIAAVVLQPLGVGIAARHLTLDIPVAQQAAVFQINRQHLAGAKPALFDDAAFIKLHHTGL